MMNVALVIGRRKKVLPLAASRDTSNGPDWKDCMVLIREIQESLDGRVELTTVLSKRKDEDVLIWKATAYPYLRVPQEARRSVSLSALIPTSSPTLTAAVIFRLLLSLDYEVSKAWAVRQAT